MKANHNWVWRAALRLAAASVLVAAGAAAETNSLRTLRAEHPRLVLLAADLARIRESIGIDATARQYTATL